MRKGSTVLLGLGLAIALVLTGCGRKGPLEPPPKSKEERAERAAKGLEPDVPDKPFILDRLLR